MSDTIRAVRGMNDILPDQTPRWQFLESVLSTTLGEYGYDEIRLPLLERTELFQRTVGEQTDIVEKEMYSFKDRNGESISLRPEGTAGCMRAGLSNGLLHNQRHRLWYAGPMFRYEKPQRGRYRQFHQVGAEAVGFDGPEVDAELLLIGNRLWSRLGLDGIRLEINSLGTPQSRSAYRDVLVAYLQEHRAALDEDSVRRLDGNPLRILDSKNPQMRPLIEAAPLLSDHLDDESARHFADLRTILDETGLPYRVNPRLVRGLDYYTRTAFEWVTDRLGAQGAVCAGGRYDGLVEQIGGRPTPAVGWAMGLERVVELLTLAEGEPRFAAPDVYLVTVGEVARRQGAVLAERLRDRLPGLRLRLHGAGGGFKAQMRAADRSAARVAVVLGDEEAQTRRAALKPLRNTNPQQTFSWDALPPALAALLGRETADPQ